VTTDRSVNESCGTLVFMVINVCQLAISVAAGVALFLTSCGGSSATSSTGTAATATAGSSATGATSQEIVVQGYKFPPITAAAGSTLKLVSKDVEAHTMTANDGTFDSTPFSPDKPTTLTVPTKAGSYPFHCKIHPTMHGTLVVQ